MDLTKIIQKEVCFGKVLAEKREKDREKVPIFFSFRVSTRDACKCGRPLRITSEALSVCYGQ